MLTRIRNASAINKPEVVMPMSKLKYQIAKILQETHWIEAVEIIKVPSKKNKTMMFDELKITLKYDANGKSVISSIQRVSKPSRRVYAGKDELPRVLNGMGIAIVSTSAGLLTNKEAGKRKIGGELICEIY
jgi:small subunit ribosomal protein S8